MNELFLLVKLVVGIAIGFRLFSLAYKYEGRILEKLFGKGPKPPVSFLPKSK